MRSTMLTLCGMRRELEYCEACGVARRVSHTASRKLTHNPARAVAHVFVTKQGYFPGQEARKEARTQIPKLATSYKRVAWCARAIAARARACEICSPARKHRGR